MKRLLWPLVGIGLLLVAFNAVEARYVFAPLLGLFIWRVGIASFGSLSQGAAHIPDGPPQAVDAAVERTTYWCSGCGAELLLLVRGAAVPPRHCGERMTERREVANAGPNRPQLGTKLWNESHAGSSARGLSPEGENSGDS